MLNPRWRSWLSLRPVIWMLAGVFTLLLKGLFSLWPEGCETLFSRGLYPFFRWIWDYSLAAIPLPLLWLILLSLPIYWFLRSRQKRRSNVLFSIIPNRWLRALVNLLGFLGFAASTFQWMWGFHYQRVPVMEQLHLEAPPLDSADLREEFIFATEQLVTSRAELGDTSLAFQEIWTPTEDLDEVIRNSLSDVLNRNGFPTPGKVRLKAVSPPGTLMYFGAAGIYLPWAGESYRPSDLPMSHLPFLMAHEMSHGYGFADEGTANFWAYLACRSTPENRYSADLHYWKYVAREMWKVDTLAFHEGRKQLCSGIRKDLKAEREHGEKYTTWFSGITSRAYNSYLKSQGIPEGYLSYSKIVRMVRAYRKSDRAS